MAEGQETSANWPAAAPTIPQHPLTLVGAAVLHQTYRMRWAKWLALKNKDRDYIAKNCRDFLDLSEQVRPGGSALFSQLGHKGDLLFVHFRSDFEDLALVETMHRQEELFEYMELVNSYVSIVELGLYDSTVKLYEELVAEGLDPSGEEWAERVKDRLKEQGEAMQPRLWPTVPGHKYLCFYPMDKKRGESHNWYTVDIRERRRMMHDHGMIGRRYAGRVKQIISGSIGFDDWEWGVDLFADDPLVFKELIYEMRFDEASALYAKFGPFHIGLRLRPSELENWLGTGPDVPSFGGE